MVDHVDLGIELTQREVVADQLRGEHQAGVFEIRGRLFCRGTEALGFAAHTAEEVELVIDERTQGEIVLHGRLVGRRIGRQRAVHGSLAASCGRL